jgi:TPR repeat protein
MSFHVPFLFSVARAASALALALLGSDAAFGAQDSAPVLLSRTGGGGGTWADLKELQAAAAKGNPKAEAALGEMLLRGEGIPRDEPRAVAMLEKSARAGNADAAFRIGMLLSRGESGVAQDLTRSRAYFRAAAAGGVAEAIFNIGAAYASARGVKRDYAEALGWLIVARQRGADPSAEQSLRTQIKSRPAWIETGERRAKEIELELKDKSVVELLPPPAPLDTPVDPLRPTLSPPPKK